MHLVESLRRSGLKSFHSPTEVLAALAHGKVGVHDRIRVRLPLLRKVVRETPADTSERPSTAGLFTTTVGRVLFNEILDTRMPFYDVATTGKQLARILADCERLMGRHETTDLLERMKDLGFREATRSGLSLAADDLKTPRGKNAVLRDTAQKVERAWETTTAGLICEAERHCSIIDLWTQARDEIAQLVVDGLRRDVRRGPSGELLLNPLFVMHQTDQRCGVEQVRQLCGMRRPDDEDQRHRHRDARQEQLP